MEIRSILYLGHFWRLNLLDLEEIAQREKGNGHGADTDHENHQGRPAADVELQVLQGANAEHASHQLRPGTDTDMSGGLPAHGSCSSHVSFI